VSDEQVSTPPQVEIAPGVFLPPGARADSFIVIDEKGQPTVMYTPSERPDGVSKAREFHACTIPNVLLHGPRGTGKSTILRFDAHMRAMAHPGFKYLILRRTMPQLRKSHLNFIHSEMKKLGGHYNKTENVAYYPEVDGKVSKGFFSHCETQADVENLLSSEFDLVIFDEITTFTIDMILKISACARCPKESGRIALVRAGTNPLGESTGDVMRYFITKSVTPEENPDYDPTEFHDIFVGPDDNEYMDMQVYQRRLSMLTGHARKAWLEGVWEVEGAYFGDFKPRRIIDGENRPWHVIDALPTVRGKSLLEQEWISIYRCIDSGFFPDPAVCIWIAVMPNGRAIAFKEESWLNTTADGVSKDIAEMSVLPPREVYGDIVQPRMHIVDSFCDPTMFATSNHTGLADSDYYEINGVALTPSRNDRAAIGKAIHEWLGTLIDGEPKLQILREGCPQLIRTIPDMQMDKNDPRKIAPGNDHYVVSLGYFCQGMTGPSHEYSTAPLPTWMRKKRGEREVVGSTAVQRLGN
jgi:phage terminase large subunit